VTEEPFFVSISFQPIERFSESAAEMNRLEIPESCSIFDVFMEGCHVDVNSARWNRRENGIVEITEISRSEWEKTEADHLIQSKFVYSWKLPYQIACQLPEDFHFSLNCFVDKGGFHRFRLPQSGWNFVLEASLVGHAVLADRRKVKKNPTFSFDEALLFSQYIQCTREYLGETVKLGRLLRISPTGRPDAGTKDILPEDIDFAFNKTGKRISVAQFKAAGIEAAKSAGISNPTPDQITWYGLFAAAQGNPFSVNDRESNNLLRFAFFTVGDKAIKIDQAAVNYVTRQVRESLADHIDDNTQEFRKWIKDDKSNLVNRIFKRKDCFPRTRDKQAKRDKVRKALLELGWSSLGMLASCVDACMRAFEAALPAPLTSAEERLYSSMYLANKSLGGFPLVMLRDRFEVIKPAVFDMWNKPDDVNAISALLRLMWYYGELVGMRRTGDRKYKRVSLKRNKGGRPITEVPLFHDDQQRVRTNEDRGLFRETAIRIARDHGHACDFDGAEWDARLVKEDDQIVKFDIACSDRNFAKTLSISRAEFERIAKDVAAD
jgi:hypothetical protein